MPKHRHGSVERNLLKRRLREIARTTILRALESIATPVDVVIRSRPEAYTAPFTALAAELVRAAERLVRLHGVTPATPLATTPRTIPPSPPPPASA